MKRPKFIHLPLDPTDKKRLEKLAKEQNTFPTRLASAIVSDAIPRMEAGQLVVRTQPRIGS